MAGGPLIHIPASFMQNSASFLLFFLLADDSQEVLWFHAGAPTLFQIKFLWCVAPLLLHLIL